MGLKNPVQVTPEEFMMLHNGKCKLLLAISRLEGVIAEKILKELQDSSVQINAGLSSAYKQEEAVSRERDRAIEVASHGKSFVSIWSMDRYDFATKVEPTPISVLYKNHWGKESISVVVQGDTWLDLWIAADEAIRKSNDSHHIFVEGFAHLGNGVFELQTGS